MTTERRQPQRRTRNVTSHVAIAVVAFAGAVYNMGDAFHVFVLTESQQSALNLVLLTGIGLASVLRVAFNQRGARKRRTSS